MIYHPRTDWQTAAQPVTGPAIDWTQIVRIVVHYPGGNVNKPYDTASRLRAEQAMYLRKTPPYSLGYNWMVDEAGHVWEVRGWDIRCAANSEVNPTSVAIQIIVDDQDAANPAQVQAVRELVAEIRRRKAGLPIVTHASVATNSSHTPCPGTGITPQVASGAFEPVADPIDPAPQPPAPNITEDYMLAIYKPEGTWWPQGYDPCWFVVFTSGKVRRATGPDVELASHLNLPTYIVRGIDYYRELHRESGTTYQAI
jgi:hypothetical protein